MTIKISIVAMGLIAFALYVSFRNCVDPTLDIDGYFVPLINGFGFEEYWHDPADTEKSNCISDGAPSRYKRVASVVSSTDREIITSTLNGIREVAVSGTIILGTKDGAKKFFFVNTKSDDEPSPELPGHEFSDQQSWIDALKDAGVSQVPKLTEPALLAKGVPDRILHPQDYRIMEGMCGWPDYAWSDNIILFSLLCIFLRGLLSKKPHLILFSIVIGIAIDFVCEIVFGDGPAALPGLVIYPLEFGIIGLAGKLMRYLALRLILKRPKAIRVATEPYVR